MRAVELFESGMKQAAIARALNVTRGAVSQWLSAYRDKGLEALRYRKITKNPCRLSQEQKDELRKLLALGAEHFGYPGAIWTLSRVRDLILRKFGISYCISNVAVILKKIGWTCQKPVVRATQRDEEASKKWLQEKWPEIKKADDEGRTIIFADESGFYLLPFVCRTYAPKGETPLLRSKLSHEHLSVASGISPAGRLYIQIQDKSFKGTDTVSFLRHLLAHVAGKILVLWDGCPIHRSREVKKFLLEEANGRVWLERIPGYSPDLNPDEGVWNYLKRAGLKNQVFSNLKELGKGLRKAIRSLRSHPHLIQACFAQAGCV